MTDPNPTGSHDDDPDDPFQSMQWERYAAHARETLVPMVKNSHVTVFFGNGADPDVKQALELGMMILLDKPIIIILDEGFSVYDLTPKLRKVVDGVIFGPIDRTNFAQDLQELVDQVMSER